MEAKLDRAREDVGNILKLEHVNITIPDQSLATPRQVLRRPLECSHAVPPAL